MLRASFISAALAGTTGRKRLGGAAAAEPCTAIPLADAAGALGPLAADARIAAAAAAACCLPATGAAARSDEFAFVVAPSTALQRQLKPCPLG